MKQNSASQGLPVKRYSFSLLTLCSLAALNAHASDSLEPMTVTANRFETSNALVPTTVITRADIERLQINDLPTLLSRVPGVDISTSGGLGSSSSIFMRGTNAGHVLILVDGVKWRSATLGTSSIQDFPVSQIERIEIVRGPRSGLYGSEAIGGVIQIFTRKGQQGTHPYFTAGYGTHNSKQLSAGISGGDHATQYQLSASHDSTRGISWKRNNNPDKDNFRNNSVQAQLDHQFNDQFSVGMNLLHVDGFNRYDSTSLTEDYFTNTEQDVWGLHSKYKVNSQWGIKASLSESRDKSRNASNNSADTYSFNHYLTKHYAGNLTSTYAINTHHTLNLGVDYDVDKVTSSVKYDKTSRQNRAVFASWQVNEAKHSWLLSVRHDDNEAFGNHTTGNAEYGYWIRPGLQLTANAGTAFKAPTFNDLYWPNSSNPNLSPEKSVSFGGGINGYQSWADWSVNIYQNRIRDLIEWQQVSSFVWLPENVATARIRGIEFEIDTQVAAWDVNFNASLLQPENLNTRKLLNRRAKQIANLSIHRSFGAWSFGSDWHLSGYRYDSSTRLGGFGTLALRTAYQLDKAWSLRLSAQNVFNKHYETANNYNALDRTLMFSIHYQ